MSDIIDYSVIQILMYDANQNKEVWVSIPTPSTLAYIRADYDAEEGSYRDIIGDMNRQRIAVKVKLELTWNSGALNIEQMSLLLKAVDPLFVSVRYFDPYEGDFVVKTMYVGDRSANMYSFINGKPVWDTVSYNLIEK